MPDRLFEIPAEWEEHWTDMPEFVQGDERPLGGSINVYFQTEEDRREFLALVGCPNPDMSRGIFYPFRKRRMDGYSEPYRPDLVGPNRYPIYVVSKGRWKAVGNRLTYIALDRLGIDYRIVIEPQELPQYAEHIDPDKILVLPFSNLGQGSIPARNWIWNHAVESGAKRHWILDDNIEAFARLNRNQHKTIKSENPFAPCEEFVDRYDNVGLAGLQYRGFVDAKHPDLAPYRLNTRIYSCILVNHAVPFKWRGKYNEDTDLSLRILKAGWATVLFQAYLAHKVQSMHLDGGNTDELYNGNGRQKMAESLQEQHPDCVTITEKWGRPQHHVDYSQFRQQLVPSARRNGHGST